MLFLKKSIPFILIFVCCTNFATSQLVYPSGGNDGIIRYPGSSQIISWTPKPIENPDSVNIYIWEAISNNFITIAANVSDSIGYFIWEIPDTFATGEYYKVKVGNDSSGYLVSFDFFSIEEEPETPGNDKGLPVTDEKQTNSISVYPNPATSFVNIKWSVKDISTLNINDKLGRIVFSKNVSNTENLSIPLDNIPSGSYYIVLITDKRKYFFEKLIIER